MIELGELDPHALFATTEKVPPGETAIHEIEFVVELQLQPDGTVHVYDVAPITVLTFNTKELPWQTELLPEIDPGCAGSVFTATFAVLAGPDPQALLATTEIIPLLALGVTAILFVVDVPVQPEGNVQV